MIDPVAAALVAIYFIAMVAIGIWASKKIQNMSDYVVAGRSLDFWVFTFLMIGSVCSGMSLLGVSGLGYKFAWPTIWEQLAVLFRLHSVSSFLVSRCMPLQKSPGT